MIALFLNDWGLCLKRQQQVNSLVELLNGNGIGFTFLEAKVTKGALILIFFIDHHPITLCLEDVDRTDLEAMTALAYSCAP